MLEMKKKTGKVEIRQQHLPIGTKNLEDWRRRFSPIPTNSQPTDLALEELIFVKHRAPEDALRSSLMTPRPSLNLFSKDRVGCAA